MIFLFGRHKKYVETVLGLLNVLCKGEFICCNLALFQNITPLISSRTIIIERAFDLNDTGVRL